MLQLICDAGGVPIRRVFGLNLYAEDLQAEPLYKVRADYVNIHTWAEVYFPKEGWIEVEPSKGKRAFVIPSRYVQNNPWFQNYSVWVKEGEKWRQPKWVRRPGGWDSDYGVKNLIHFESIPLGEGDPTRHPRVWNSANGGYSVLATLIGRDTKVAELATNEGRRIKVPWDRLSEADRDAVETD